MFKRKQTDPSRVVRTNLRVPMIVGFLAFALLFGGAGGWMAYANISGAVIASGSVSVKGKPKTIQHLDGGIVSEIKVANGDIVQRGDVLLRLDGTLLRANLQIYDERLREALARKSRLTAERDGAESVTWHEVDIESVKAEPGDDNKVGQDRLFHARRNSITGQVKQLNEKIAQFNNQVEGVKGLKSSKADQIGFISRELEGLNELFDDGNTTLNRLMALERQKSDLLGQQAEHDAELARIANSINETKLQILQLRHEARKEVLTELRTTTQEVNELVQQIHATKEQLKRIDITAAVDGMIHELSVFTIGGVVGPGAPIMQIVPQNEELEVEAQVEPQFIDDLYVGQDATVRFTAFNQRETPELFGAVTSISPSSVVDERTGLAYYNVGLTIPQNELARLNGKKLIPGMPVEAHVRTDERTVLNYLVKPLLDQVQRAFREE